MTFPINPSFAILGNQRNKKNNNVAVKQAFAWLYYSHIIIATQWICYFVQQVI